MESKYLYSYEVKKIEEMEELENWVKMYRKKYESDSRKMLALVNTLKSASCIASTYARERIIFKYLRAWNGIGKTIWVND